MKLDYGSGMQPREGFLTSDYTGTSNYDYFIDNYKVVGAEDNTFSVINCRNVLHHIPECDLEKVFNEFYRLLKDDGVLIISEPREEFHFQNLVLDIIWYRFLIYDRNIMIPKEYVDYKSYLYNFQKVEEYIDFNNEIIYYVKN